MSDAAIAAVVGAGVGALATAGVQSGLARLDRIGRARGACRVMYADLLEARDGLGVALEDGEWTRRRGFRQVVTAWHQHRDAVSRAVGVQDFHDVAGAFKALERLQVIREANADTPDQGFVHAHEKAIDALDRVEGAHLILMRAGCTFWERWVTVRPRVVGTHEFEIADPLLDPDPEPVQDADDSK